MGEFAIGQSVSRFEDPRLLQGVKGIKVNPEAEVVVEFTPN